jgi:hypothetical protein
VALEGLSNALGPRVQPSQRCYCTTATTGDLRHRKASYCASVIVRPSWLRFVAPRYRPSPASISRKGFRVNPGRVTLGACT